MRSGCHRIGTNSNRLSRSISYYHVGDPSYASEYLAWYSHQELARITEIMNTYNWESSPELSQEMVTITRDLFRETAMMNMGMIDYVTKYDSPNTIGENRVPISDFSTLRTPISTMSHAMKTCGYVLISHIHTSETLRSGLDERMIPRRRTPS